MELDGSLERVSKPVQPEFCTFGATAKDMEGKQLAQRKDLHHYSWDGLPLVCFLE